MSERRAGPKDAEMDPWSRTFEQLVVASLCLVRGWHLGEKLRADVHTRFPGGAPSCNLFYAVKITGVGLIWLNYVNHNCFYFFVATKR